MGTLVSVLVEAVTAIVDDVVKGVVEFIVSLFRRDRNER